MDKAVRVLIVDDEEVIREGSRKALETRGYLVKGAEDGEAALRAVDEAPFDIALLDLKLPGMDGLEVLRSLKEKDESLVIVVITGYPSIESAVEAMRLGAYDYIAKPFTPDELRLVVSRAAEKRQLLFQCEFLRRRLDLSRQEDSIVGESPAMKRVFEMVARVASTDSTVLIMGESGTGKELVARAIHQHSPRRDREFVPIDCSSLVETLLESELFGHVKGSFTGATHTKHGCFELANGGTFFFDEVGNLSLNIQAKILRAIQEREIKQVGGMRQVKVDVRIISATNQDLKASISQRAFREDLYYRLSVVPIVVPPLRERKEDTPLLAHHFIRKFNRRRQVPITAVAPDAMTALTRYDWPGNVRELQNAVERATVLVDGDTITAKDLPWHIRANEPLSIRGFRDGHMTLEELEKQYIQKVLDDMGWQKTKVAKALGIDRKTLYQKIGRYSLKPKPV
jgi:DNA-binding NtrC family response regulator